MAVALRRLDPRFDPSIRPHEWEAVTRRRRLFARVAAGMLVALLMAAGVYLWFPFDRTKGLAPEAVAKAAGLAILDANGYRFTVDLTGTTKAYPFPATTLKGEYQASPLVLHVAGSVLSGDSPVPVGYYLAGPDLYVFHPTQKVWLRNKEEDAPELRAFLPENLAAPLAVGVRKAEVVGRDKLPGGEAVQLKLELDPRVVLPGLPQAKAQQAQYRLWVYTRSLQPAQFTMDVDTQAAAGEGGQERLRFTYTLTWEFSRLKALTVPDDVKRSPK